MADELETHRRQRQELQLEKWKSLLAGSQPLVTNLLILNRATQDINGMIASNHARAMFASGNYRVERSPSGEEHIARKNGAVGNSELDHWPEEATIEALHAWQTGEAPIPARVARALLSLLLEEVETRDPDLDYLP